MQPNLYIIQRFLCVPLEEAHVPLVVRVPHFENHCPRISLYALTLRFVLMEITKVVKHVH